MKILSFFNYFLVIILIGLLSCKGDNSGPSNNNNNNGNDKRPQVQTRYLNLAYGFTTMHSNLQYRPLGNNPIQSPYTQSSLFHAFDTVGFQGTGLISENLSTLDDDPLDNLNSDSFKEFYKNYKTANNLTTDDYTTICFFGIIRIHHPYEEGEMGQTFAFKELPYDKDTFDIPIYAPSICFVFVGACDSSGISNSWSVDNRKKYFILIYVHEIGHARGLNDLSGNCNEHTCHYDPINTNCLYCAMAWHSGADLQYAFPCLFCQKHFDYLRDSLSTKIISGLYMALPDCIH